jgi:hypothetical protein
MPDIDPCELCGTSVETAGLGGGYDGIRQSCPRCGDFKLPRASSIRKVSQHGKVRLSGWVRDRNCLGEVPELTSEQISIVLASPAPGVMERADRLLSHAITSQKKLGETICIDLHAEFEPITYSLDSDELMYLARFLDEEGFIKFVDQKAEVSITPRGYMRYEDLQTRSSASAQGFVAMWFDESMRCVYSPGFETGIREAGYDPLRVDSVEHVGKIDDEIIAQIRRSRFVVADFTGHRAGVYFEAGFALGLNLPVIWSCRRDHIGKLHFDKRQFNCIDWTEPTELAERLRKRIEAAIGAGPRKPAS